jgi:hypothetical protein
MIRGILTILTVAGLSSLTAGANQTASVTLAWTPSSSPNIAGYDIYYGTSSSNYTSSISVSNVTEVTILGLTSGTTYYFAAKTYSSSGSLSAFSPQISYMAGTTSAIPAAITLQLASPPGQFSFSVSGTSGFEYAVEASTNLVNWVVLGTNTAPFIFVDPNAGQFKHRFYRAIYAPNVIFTLPPTAGVLTSAFANASGQFSFTVSGTAGYPYAVEASTNLVNWIILGTNTAPFNFVDTNASQFPRRFYRAVYDPGTNAGSSNASSPSTNSIGTTTGTTNAATPVLVPLPPNQAGQFRFMVSGKTGYPYVVETSSDLKNWIMAEMNTAPFTFVDNNTALYTRRFYRAVYFGN